MAWTDLVRSGALKAAEFTHRGASRAKGEMRARRLRRQISREQARIARAVVARIQAGEPLDEQLPEIRDSVARIGTLSDELASLADGEQRSASAQQEP
jgi:hypothetical protein